MDTIHKVISDIPTEIIEQILEEETLGFNDICSFGRTCNTYWDLVNKHGNKIWKTKFKQKWPKLAEHKAYKSHVVHDWLDECRQRSLIGRRAMQIIGGMSNIHIKHEELSPTDFGRFDELMKESGHSLALFFMIDELMVCIHHPNRNINLTNKYYSEKTLRHLRQIEVTKKWDEYKNLPPEAQLLEQGAVLIAQWSQPTEEITDKLIGEQFDAIAERVCKQLLLEHGEKHPALCVSEETRTLWRTRNISDNHYSASVSRQIIAATAHVLFKEMGFCGNSELYYSHENSYINKVLENRCGIPITLAIVYESVTRRLGVKCEPVSFPGHFLLRWRDSYKENETLQQYYIDVFNGGQFLGKDSCPQFAGSGLSGRCPMSQVPRFGPATAMEVMERMANNLERAERQHTVMNGRAARLRSALELGHVINSHNTHCMLQLARFYMQYNMSVTSLRHSLERNLQSRFDMRDRGQAAYILRTLIDYDENYSHHLREATEGLEVKRRVGVDVQFSVGLVMRHRRYNYTCVITGWDPTCVASEEWIVQMNVRSLQRQNCQPFYYVLVSDGTNRYAAEENLELEQEEDSWVSHSDIGRYFREFCGRYYLLNSEMSCAYPDDAEVTYRLIHVEP